MKTARIFLSSLELICPACDNNIPSDDGSFTFPIDEIPETVRCYDCEENFEVPESVRKV